MEINKNYTWIIGDVHGMFDHLNQMLSYLKDTGVKKYIFLGDYIDIGPSSKQVLDIIIQLKEEKICLMGDHEHMLLDEVLAEKHKALLPKFLWEFNGGSKTMNSFGYENVDDFYRETPKVYGEFFEKLKITHQEEFEYKGKKLKFLFAHAGIYPFSDFEQQTTLSGYKEFTEYFLQNGKDHSNSPVWIRNSFFEAKPEFWKKNIVIHGHTPTQKLHYFTSLPIQEEEDNFSVINPEYYLPNLPFLRKDAKSGNIVSINLDTGVEEGKRLTAVGISADNFFSNEDGNFLKLEFVQIDSSTGFSGEGSIRFFEYNINVDKQAI